MLNHYIGWHNVMNKVKVYNRIKNWLKAIIKKVL